MFGYEFYYPGHKFTVELIMKISYIYLYIYKYIYNLPYLHYTYLIHIILYDEFIIWNQECRCIAADSERKGEGGVEGRLCT